MTFVPDYETVTAVNVYPHIQVTKIVIELTPEEASSLGYMVGSFLAEGGRFSNASSNLTYLHDLIKTAINQETSTS